MPRLRNTLPQEREADNPYYVRVEERRAPVSDILEIPGIACKNRPRWAGQTTGTPVETAAAAPRSGPPFPPMSKVLAIAEALSQVVQPDLFLMDDCDVTRAELKAALQLIALSLDVRIEKSPVFLRFADGRRQFVEGYRLPRAEDRRLISLFCYDPILPVRE